MVRWWWWWWYPTMVIKSTDCEHLCYVPTPSTQPTIIQFRIKITKQFMSTLNPPPSSLILHSEVGKVYGLGRCRHPAILHGPSTPGVPSGLQTHQSMSGYCVWHNIVIATLTADWWCACATFTLIDEHSDSCLLFAYVNERVCAASRMLYLHRLLVIAHCRKVERLKHSSAANIVPVRVVGVCPL